MSEEQLKEEEIIQEELEAVLPEEEEQEQVVENIHRMKTFTSHFGYYVYEIELDPAEITNLLEPDELEVERKRVFYSKLEDSILTEGIRNPIMVNAGYVESPMDRKLPVEERADPSKILACCRYGGSRLYFAHKHNLPKISCLVSDFVGKYKDSNYKIIKTQQEAEEFFEPRIKEVVVTRAGLWGKA